MSAAAPPRATPVELSDEFYRDAAARRYGAPGLRVPVWATVYRAPGGAFVELAAWVPDDDAAPNAPTDVRRTGGAS